MTLVLPERTYPNLRERAAIARIAHVVPGPAIRRCVQAWPAPDRASRLRDLLTIFLSTAGSGGIDHVVNGTGRSATVANPGAAVDVASYPW